MSRKFDRQLKINEKVRDILEDPYTLFYLGSRLIRKKPKLMPLFIWKALLWAVMAPGTKQKNVEVEVPAPQQ